MITLVYDDRVSVSTSARGIRHRGDWTLSVNIWHFVFAECFECVLGVYSLRYFFPCSSSALYGQRCEWDPAGRIPAYCLPMECESEEQVACYPLSMTARA